MSDGTALAARIVAEIRTRGYVTVARFMEMALYEPELGYYRPARSVFGPGGDFYTAENLQPVYGELLASFVEAFRISDVLELGAGNGGMRAAFPEGRYRGFDWDSDALPESFTGLIFANEFVDALPVHLLRRTGSGWIEVVIGLRGDLFVLEAGSKAQGELLEYAERYGREIPEGGLLEANIEARRWMRRLGEMLRDGYILLVDYGYSAQELIRFPRGTLMAYENHQASDNWLSGPGTRDITAHVNFTDLRETAMNSGFEVVSEMSLGAWVLSVWTEEELSRRWEKADQRWRLQWKQLMFGMGETFRVLLLKKTAPNKNAPENRGR